MYIGRFINKSLADFYFLKIKLINEISSFCFSYWTYAKERRKGGAIFKSPPESLRYAIPGQIKMLLV